MATTFHYTYDDCVRGVEKIAQLIQAKEEQFDFIVGVARGGCIPSVLLSHKLAIPLIVINRSRIDHPEINEAGINQILYGKRILIVDDIVDSGTTISDIIKDYSSVVEYQKVCALLYNVAQEIKVDYYHKTIDRTTEKRWVHFFWEII